MSQNTHREHELGNRNADGWLQLAQWHDVHARERERGHGRVRAWVEMLSLPWVFCESVVGWHRLAPYIYQPKSVRYTRLRQSCHSGRGLVQLLATGHTLTRAPWPN